MNYKTPLIATIFYALGYIAMLVSVGVFLIALHDQNEQNIVRSLEVLAGSLAPLAVGYALECLGKMAHYAGRPR